MKTYSYLFSFSKTTVKKSQEAGVSDSFEMVGLLPQTDSTSPPWRTLQEIFPAVLYKAV